MERRRLIVEALVCLIVARVLIAAVPFRRLSRLFTRKVALRNLTPEARQHVTTQVRHAISAATRRAPWPMMCFPQAVAAQDMLRRRGIPTTLYYGAATRAEARLSAHVWLKDGDTGVVGHETASRFAVLATFSNFRCDSPGTVR